MEKSKKNIAGVVREIAEPVAESLGYMLWDVEYVKEGADMILRLTIDSDAGIGLNDCEAMSRAIDPVLDKADPIEVSYKLEVSSPGVERTLTRPEHFAKCIGEKVEVRLYAPVNGQKQLCGTLTSADSEKITLDVAGSTTDVKMSDAAKVSTVFEW